MNNELTYIREETEMLCDKLGKTLRIPTNLLDLRYTDGGWNVYFDDFCVPDLEGPEALIRITPLSKAIKVLFKTTMYHGYASKVTGWIPSVGAAKLLTDFGPGLYTTSDLEQARAWSLLRGGVFVDPAHILSLDLEFEKLKALDLEGEYCLEFLKPSLVWAMYILLSRFAMNGDYRSSQEEADNWSIVVGPMADGDVGGYLSEIIKASNEKWKGSPEGNPFRINRERYIQYSKLKSIEDPFLKYLRIGRVEFVDYFTLAPTALDFYEKISVVLSGKFFKDEIGSQMCIRTDLLNPAFSVHHAREDQYENSISSRSSVGDK